MVNCSNLLLQLIVVKRHRFGWTLIELLLVMAILSLLAALLLPAMITAKASAEKVVCIEHFREVSQGAISYLNDYDDIFTPVSQNPMDAVMPISVQTPSGHTWVQLLLPYTQSFSLFWCPSDYTRQGLGIDVFDKDIVPGDLYSRYHAASMRVNTGFNFMALSPIVRNQNSWLNLPSSYGAIADTSTTLLFLDSAHEVSASGKPSGGGSWLVDPPCRYEMNPAGQLMDMFAAGGFSFGNIFSLGKWSTSDGRPYGGAYPWHNEFVTVAKTDGSVSMMRTAALVQGCDPDSQVLIGGSPNPSSYPWSIAQ